MGQFRLVPAQLPVFLSPCRPMALVDRLMGPFCLWLTTLPGFLLSSLDWTAQSKSSPRHAIDEMKLGTTNLQQPPNRIPHPPPGNSDLAPRVRTCPLHEFELKQNRLELLRADYAVCVGIGLRSGASHGYLTGTPLVLSSPKQNLGRHGLPRREIGCRRVDDSPASRSQAWHEGGGEREIETPPCGSSSSADCSGSGGGSVLFIGAHQGGARGMATIAAGHRNWSGLCLNHR
jgi:hypothetical protein